MESHENMDRHLKQSLDDFSVQPRISSFDEILLKLERKKRRRILWFLFPGLFIAGGLAVFYLFPGNTDRVYSGHLNNKLVNARPEHPAYTGNKNTEPAAFSAGARKMKAGPAGRSHIQKSSGTRHKKEDQKNSGSAAEPQEPVQDPVLVIEDPSTQTTSEPFSLPAQTAIPAPDPVFAVMADRLAPVTMRLPYDPNSVEAKVTFNEQGPDALLTSGKKNTLRFFRGISFEPQLNTYLLSDNKKSYSSESFRSFYLKNRRDQNTIGFNYALGIKGGVVLNDKWEFQSGLGFQQFKYSEKVYPMSPPGKMVYNAAPASQGVQSYDPRRGFVWNTSSAMEYDKAYINRFNYIWHTSEVARYFTFSNLIKIKAGMGLRLGYLFGGTIVNARGIDMYDDYSYTRPFTGSPLLATLNLKLGYLEDLGKRMQLQICPNAFYTPNSMFRGYYPIKQRALGAGVEFILLYKLN